MLTQQKQDQVSPGSWVETVEVREGVNASNDGKIDTWSDWQEVSEQYDYIEGFSRQIAGLHGSFQAAGRLRLPV